eukprot:CFRG5598T1
MFNVNELAGPAQIGVMNAFRTGNTTLDLCMCVMIPMLFSAVLAYGNEYLPKIKELWERLLKRKHVTYSRHIEYSKNYQYYGNSHNGNTDANNHVLHKAILMYVTKNCDLKFSGGHFRLVENTEKTRSSRYYHYDDDESDGSELDQLRSFSIVTAPPVDQSIDVQNGVELTVTSNEQMTEQGAIQKLTTSFTLSATGDDAKEKVDAFVLSAFEWYKEHVASQIDNSRYMYVIRKTSGGTNDEEGDDNVIYKRYALSEEKTFDSLFFTQKAALMRLLGHFEKREGKFAIPSYPKRLSLLLHGPPGTGKTSLIKALAQHTGRHVINLSLGRIKTNQELMDVMFDQCFQVGSGLPMKHKFKQVVFVMEDIDCASKIVYARDTEADKADKKNDTDSDSLLPSLLVEGPKKANGLLETSVEDALNLAGLLNVIDGVVDCPNRILILTTNHPEKLDPALIRPGRVNMTVHLGYMQTPQVIEIVQHYFACTLTDDEMEAIDAIMAGSKRLFTPAEMEQLCCEFDTISDFMEGFHLLSSKEKKILTARDYATERPLDSVKSDCARRSLSVDSALEGENKSLDEYVESSSISLAGSEDEDELNSEIPNLACCDVTTEARPEQLVLATTVDV